MGRKDVVSERAHPGLLLPPGPSANTAIRVWEGGPEAARSGMDLEWKAGARKDGAGGVRLGAHQKRLRMLHSESGGSSESSTGQVTHGSEENLDNHWQPRERFPRCQAP